MVSLPCSAYFLSLTDVILLRPGPTLLAFGQDIQDPSCALQLTFCAFGHSMRNCPLLLLVRVQDGRPLGRGIEQCMPPDVKLEDHLEARVRNVELVVRSFSWLF